MNREYPTQNPNLKHDEAEEQRTVADDLKFIRSVIEKTHRAFDPGSPVMIVWGLIFLVGYPVTQFLSTPQLHELIQPMWIILWVIGASVAMFHGLRCELRERQADFISQLSRQIGLIWYILLLNGTVWSGMRLFDISFGELVFLWAVIFGFGLSIMGILSSKEWLFGGIAVLISILAASIMKEHAYVILGVVMGLACIIPATIAQRNYRKQERENA